MNTELFARKPLPARLCNLERLEQTMIARRLDAIVATTSYNVFYLSSFNGIAHKADEPRPFAVILSRHALDHPVMVIADYYLSTFLHQPTWIEDIRPFRAVMMPLDLAARHSDIDRFIPHIDNNTPDWLDNARRHYDFDMSSVVRQALADLGLQQGRIAFDDMGFGYRLNLEQITVVDGYDPLMYARAVKSGSELDLLQRSTRLNQQAIEHTVNCWNKGLTWGELNRVYHRAATDLGGFVRDPGAMVWGHPRGSDPALTLQTGLENAELEAGVHVMFDCHGTLDLYCWDGGKTWVVDGEPEGDARRYARATATVAPALIEAMRPGIRISELQAEGRRLYRQNGVPDPDSAVIFFHGLGLSHMDLELVTAEGRANTDWALEENMVVPLHLLYPGAESERSWLEEVVVVGKDGGRPLFSWGFEPLTGS